MKELLRLTDKGLYCENGDFYIDPSRAVKNAVITHAHSDHAVRGCDNYWCASKLNQILHHRIGKKANVIPIEYGKETRFNDVKVSFHPAGHMLGSSQIRVEHEGNVWVVSGDYKRDHDPTCEPFEPIKCDVFITEATFASPTYEWRSANEVVKEISKWWDSNKKINHASILYCYSLGKAQRILGHLSKSKLPIYVHKAIEPYNKYYREAGIKLANTEIIDENTNPKKLNKSLILAPPSSELYLSGIPYKTAFASGWMHTYNPFTRGVYDAAFPLSDHADWPSLLKTIEETEAKRVLVTHGKADELVSHLRKKGIQAEALPRESIFFKRPQLTLKHFFQ